MSTDNWINATISLFTLLTAIFTYVSAVQAKRMVDSSFRPMLVITPGKHTQEFVHQPNIKVQNFGKGPAIIEEIQFFGMELTSIRVEDMKMTQTSSPIRIKPREIIRTDLEIEFKTENNFGYYFGEAEGVKFAVKYRDYTKKPKHYTATCEWNKERKQWDRYGD